MCDSLCTEQIFWKFVINVVYWSWFFHPYKTLNIKLANVLLLHVEIFYKFNIVNTVISTEGNFKFYQAIKTGPGDHLNKCGGIILKWIMKYDDTLVCGFYREQCTWTLNWGKSDLGPLKLNIKQGTTLNWGALSKGSTVVCRCPNRISLFKDRAYWQDLWWSLYLL
jgi:hypothetical protein